MNCMSAYSMPLWTILTKWPAPSGPIQAQHGSPSTRAAIDSRIGTERGIRLLRAAGHDRRPGERTDLAAGDAGADEVEADLAQPRLTAAGVVEVRVAAVDDDVAGLEQRDELVDDGVGGRARLDHDDDAARPLEGGDEVGHRVGGDERPLRAVLLDELRRPGAGAVVDGDDVVVVRQVAGEVAAHDGEAGDPDGREGLRGGRTSAQTSLRRRRRSADAADPGRRSRVETPHTFPSTRMMPDVRATRRGLCPGSDPGRGPGPDRWRGGVSRWRGRSRRPRPGRRRRRPR